MLNTHIDVIFIYSLTCNCAHALTSQVRRKASQRYGDFGFSYLLASCNITYHSNLSKCSHILF